MPIEHNRDSCSLPTTPGGIPPVLYVSCRRLVKPRAINRYSFCWKSLHLNDVAIKKATAPNPAELVEIEQLCEEIVSSHYMQSINRNTKLKQSDISVQQHNYQDQYRWWSMSWILFTVCSTPDIGGRVKIVNKRNGRINVRWKFDHVEGSIPIFASCGILRSRFFSFRRYTKTQNKYENSDILWITIVRNKNTCAVSGTETCGNQYIYIKKY